MRPPKSVPPTVHCTAVLEVARIGGRHAHEVTVEADVSWQDGEEPRFGAFEAWCVYCTGHRFPFSVDDFTSLERQVAEDMLLEEYVEAEKAERGAA